MQKSGPLLLILVVGLVFTACDTGITGEQELNQPPKTYLTVDEINRSDDNRLSSRITISWWGDDPDGYIDGFEYAINDTSEGNWGFTQRTDSTFVLPISSGQSFDDVFFKVRAIDNDGATDPVGASVVFPIKNTPPTVDIVSTESAPDTTFNIVSFGWLVDDPDGFVNIAKTEIAFNDTTGPWTQIPIEGENEVFISLEIGDTSSDIFLGRNYRQTDITVDGIDLNAKNMFYVRTVDQAGARSTVDTLSWYVKEQKSDILLIRDFSEGADTDFYEFTRETLSEIGFSNIDVWDVGGGEFGSDGKVRLSDKLPNVIDPVLQRAMAQWDHIYWLSNSLNRNLAYAQEMLQPFFGNGGTLFINIPSSRISSTDPLLNFIPIESFTNYSGDDGRGDGPFIIRNSEIMPVSESISELPILQITNSEINIYGFKPIPSAEPLYEADIKMRTITGFEEYDAPNTLSVQNPEGNLIYFGLELQTVNGYNNIDTLLNKFLNDELCFDGSCQ